MHTHGLGCRMTPPRAKLSVHACMHACCRPVLQCSQPMAGAVASHPMLTLERWDPWRSQLDLIRQIKAFLEVRYSTCRPRNHVPVFMQRPACARAVTVALPLGNCATCEGRLAGVRGHLSGLAMTHARACLPECVHAHVPQVHARVDLDSPLNDISVHADACYTPLQRNLSRLEALAGVEPLRRPTHEALYSAREAYAHDAARLQALNESKKRTREEEGKQGSRAAVWAKGTGYGYGHAATKDGERIRLRCWLSVPGGCA